MKIRSTFRRNRKGSSNGNVSRNLHYHAVKNIRRSNERNNWLYDPSRKRDAAELETMRRAAQKNPHGRAATMLANKMQTHPVKKARAVRVKAS